MGAKVGSKGADEIIRTLRPDLKDKLAKSLCDRYSRMKINVDFICYAKKVNPRDFRTRLLAWGDRSGIPMDPSAPTSAILAQLTDPQTVKLNAIMRRVSSDYSDPLIRDGINRRVRLFAMIEIEISYKLCIWGVYAEAEVRQHLVNQGLPLSLWGM